jgi:hypothetical protein
MGFWRFLVASVAVFFLLPTPPSQGRRGQAYIDDVRLYLGPGGDVTLDFRVKKVLDDFIADTLDSGLPVRFTHLIRVIQPRELKRDNVLVDLKLVRVLEKDNLKDRFRVTLEDTGESRQYGDLREAVEVMTRVEKVSLFPADVLETHRPLFLKIKTQLQKFQLPFRLHYLLAFLSYWDVETDWYTQELPPDQDALR